MILTSKVHKVSYAICVQRSAVGSVGSGTCVTPLGILLLHVDELCRANMAHIRQSRPDSGLAVKVKVFETLLFPLCSEAVY